MAMLDDLNEAQYTAVTSPSDVLQILAPPGSGKTKTLTSRVAHLLHHNNYKPWNVICLTFTIKSSREMRDRIARLLGNGMERKLILGTFHSVCRRYLVTYGHLIGLRKDFGIADSSDTMSIIKRIIKRLGVSVDARKAQSRISSSKSRGISHAVLAQGKGNKKDAEQQEFAMVFEAYEDQLAVSNLLDYDDLLLRCVDLLRQHPTCVSNVEAVLIDEFQDTNVVQFDLMELFASKQKRITTVGDPDQSIYGWRSAEIKNLGKMQTLYPDTLVIHLKDNYRSSGAILVAAHEVIEQDESRPSKPLLPTHCPGTVPVLRRLPSADIEALWIVSEIQRAIGLTGNVLEFSDFAVLLRSASLSRHMESAMGKARIPYRMVGGQRFFDRVEIKILLDYLRVVSQPHNNDALSRIINNPRRGVGEATIKGLLEEAETKGKSLWTCLRDSVHGSNNLSTKMSKAGRNGVDCLIGIVLQARNKLLSPTVPLSPEELLKHIIKKLDFQVYLEKTHSDDHETRWANVKELLAQASEFPVLFGDTTADEEAELPKIKGLEQAKGHAADEALSKFLATVALATELQREDEDAEERPHSQVTISTIHAAKGLEWPVVFVPSAYEGSIPHSRAEDSDEERRLLYVAMTRAQALLYLSCPVKNSQREETTLSPFLSTKKVTPYLTNQAPAIRLATVNDICRILRRECPTPAQIVETSKTLKSQYDDLWPLKGEEDFKSAGARWSKWDDQGGAGQGAKRRRLMEDDTKANVDRDVLFSAQLPSWSTIGTSTTMQNSSTFSCSGFVSATSQLRQDAELKENETAENSKRTSKPAKGIRGVHTDAMRGSLMTFWGQSRTVNSRPPESSKKQPLPEENRFKVGISNDSEHITGHLASTSSPTISMQTSIVDVEPTRRKPLASIPHLLSTHPLPTGSKLNRPSPQNIEDQSSKKDYIFLSSSPPQSGTMLEEVERASEVKSPVKTAGIAPPQTGLTTAKKTLGVRRGMNGWAAKAKQGFSVPSGKRLRPTSSGH